MSKELLTRITDGFSDERGDIVNVLRGTPLSHVAVITSKANTVRGNHWHPKEDQYMYLISGRYLSFAQQVGYDEITVQLVRAGTLAYCPPGIAHAYYFLEDSVFLNLGQDPRLSEDFDNHTKKFDIIDLNGRPIL